MTPPQPTFTEFDARNPLGAGRTVIEASAGTGKTFTISALVARLIAEEGIALDEILVVTFTRAATAELRARVRDRLVTSLQAIEGSLPDEPDEHLAVLLAAAEADRRRYRERLHQAVTHFDRAQIFTIHGFASRLLGHLGLRARLSPELEPAEVDELLLAETASDLIVGRFAHDGAAAPVKTKDVTAIGRAVVATPDARIVPAPNEVSGEARARVEMAHELRTEMRRRMRRAGLVSFDDGLIEVRDALTDAEVGGAAQDLLARRYSVALVDESQDTDPTQWQVIRAVFDESRLVVIGDPKQSIYSFRGADVEAYLSALDGAAALATLATNWRSDGPLLDALDALFSGVSFGDDRIVYQHVRPAPGHAQPRIHGSNAPLTIRRFSDALKIRTRKDGVFYVDEARHAVAKDVAAEVVRMLTSGVTIKAPDGTGSRPLRPDQIAVLCRTRKQVDLVRAALTRCSVPSVAARTGGVFASAAAEEWRRFLHGVESPDRFDRVRLAASSLLIGMSPQQVAAMSDDEVLELQRRLRAWQELLHDEGVPALLAAVNRSTGLSARVLAKPDGERVTTDVTHIAEEMHAVWRRRRIGSLVGWLEAAMTEAEQREVGHIEEPESRQRRLETDADAVQVQTVHAAKGLQWPVVLVPYAWDESKFTPSIPVFHAEPDPAAMLRPRLIDVGGRGGPDFNAHCAAATAEDTAEEGRLLYVALTRAEHQLTVWWMENTHNAADSKLADLITRDGRTPEQLVASSGGTIEMPVLAALPAIEPYQPAAPAPVALERARFDRTLDYDWRRASFSSLSPEHIIGDAVETSERPLRSDEAAVDELEAEPLVPGPALPMADLPRGARFGTLVHHVFEHVPFDAPDLSAAIGEALAPDVRHGGWDFDVDALVGGIEAAMLTPLGPDPAAPRLRDLDPRRVLDELVFELPVRTGAGTVSLGDIGAVMRDHLGEGHPYRGYAESLISGDGQRFRGFLTGAIDVTAAVPAPAGDRFVIIDYKSNAMPATGDVATPADYGPAPLAAAMIDGNYVLQATLYQVALHRYLQWRLRGYDPARHLGGAMYLFVRGMAGAATPVVDGERCGVVRWHPPAAMVVALSELFSGGSP